MNRPDLPPNWPQLLAAFADGEHDESRQHDVEAWLASHPETRAQLEAQLRFSPNNSLFCDAIRPDAPSDATWERVWNRIDVELDAPRPAPSRRSRLSWWRRGLMVAMIAIPTAAAAAVVLQVSWPDRALIPRVAPQDDSDEALVVANSADVEIHSIRDTDAPQLVVGNPPLDEAMTLVVSGDVRLDDLKPAGDGMVPEIQMGGWSDAPLIYAPMARNP